MPVAQHFKSIERELEQSIGGAEFFSVSEEKADFAKITTEALKELLKIDPEDLFTSIITEVQRREHSLEKTSTITATKSSESCFEKRWHKFNENMEGEKHYVLQTPLQWECKYHMEDNHSSRILADVFMSKERALSYYLFLQKHIDKMMSTITKI